MAASAVAAATVLAVLRWALCPPRPASITSPLRTVLPALAPDQLARLDYPPDAFPGARDVATPYGSMRVYEFGPAQGRKVLLVHGISTSCQTLGPIAHSLVAHAGCRVMLFDLFGRGFSDGVGDLPHDARLYTSQMLLALASSPLSWTGDGALDVLGYSMGGGVAVNFAAAFPRMVRSLVLLAPAGLIRPERFGVAARFVFTSGIVPERLLAAVTRRRLRQPLSNATKTPKPRTKTKTKSTPAKTSRDEVAVQVVHAVEKAVGDAVEEVVHEAVAPIDAAVAEVSDTQAAIAPAAADPPPEKDGVVLSIQVMRYVRWMLEYHAGFVPAFMSCVRDAPLMGQQAAWEQLAAAVQHSDPAQRLPLCIVLGRRDTVVNALDYEEDVLPMLGGRENVTWTLVPGGHEFPMTYSRPVLRTIYAFWGGQEEALAKLKLEEEEEEATTKTEEAGKAAADTKSG